MTDDFLYNKKVTCLCCQHQFETKKVRNSKIAVRKKDSDFCTYFERINPYFYDVMVCSQCGFAFTESFSPLKTEQLAVLKKEYLDKIGKIELTDTREINDALRLFKLALICAGLKDESAVTIAGLYLKIAWLYRYLGSIQEEYKYLEKARNSYQIGYERPANDNSMSEEKIVYLLGELNGRLGNYQEARRWFNQLLSNRSADPALKNLARDQWAEYKTSLAAQTY